MATGTLWHTYVRLNVANIQEPFKSQVSTRSSNIVIKEKKFNLKSHAKCSNVINWDGMLYYDNRYVLSLHIFVKF